MSDAFWCTNGVWRVACGVSLAACGLRRVACCVLHVADRTSGGPYGENIAAGVGGGYDVTKGFNSWANEACEWFRRCPRNFVILPHLIAPSLPLTYPSHLLTSPSPHLPTSPTHLTFLYLLPCSPHLISLSGPSAPPSAADVSALYNYSSPGYSGTTGHFTQLVWKATSQIGCAAVTCPDGSIFTGYGQNSLYLVCEYYVPGNWVDPSNSANTAKYFTQNVGPYQA
jgi:hypothetical protein